MPRAKGQSGLRFPGFSGRVEKRARELGYANLSAFARDKKIDKSSVYAWASDRVPGADNLERLARELDVDWQWLLVGDWQPVGGLVTARTSQPSGETLPMPEDAMPSEKATLQKIWVKVTKVWRAHKAGDLDGEADWRAITRVLHVEESPEPKPVAESTPVKPPSGKLRTGVKP